MEWLMVFTVANEMLVERLLYRITDLNVIDWSCAKTEYVWSIDQNKKLRSLVEMRGQSMMFYHFVRLDGRH